MNWHNALLSLLWIGAGSGITVTVFSIPGLIEYDWPRWIPVAGFGLCIVSTFFLVGLST